MKQARVTVIPEKTKRGPVNDFGVAVTKEHGYVALNTLYWFKDTGVRFFVRNGKTGADFYKPCKYGFSITRITTSGLRKHLGFVEMPTAKI